MIMYEPQQGMATFVPEGMENDYLAKGYRTTPPEQPHPQPQSQQTSINDGDEDKDETPARVKVNSATLKELTERFGLSTVQAKELREGRPYATVEDLIAKIPDIDWVALSPQINFE
jgi:DNA uptake protein ComE-like DNA-binding protein